MKKASRPEGVKQQSAVDAVHLLWHVAPPESAVVKVKVKTMEEIACGYAITWREGGSMARQWTRVPADVTCEECRHAMFRKGAR